VWRSPKLTFIALIVVCILPVVASYLTFYFWQPSATVNYGELVGPTPLPDGRAAGLAGQPDIDLVSLRGKWTLVYTGASACDQRCAESLYAMRQTRLAQGDEARRVSRLWLVTDAVAPTAEALEGQRDLRVAAAVPEWLEVMPGAESHVYLVDPIGNAMMRFPSDPDIKEVIKDLKRLLKYSGLG
jgi:hypothetical protein